MGATDFDITENDIGRYVRRKSTGEIGRVRRDPGNGWLHPGIMYEWKPYRHDLEYVAVISYSVIPELEHVFDLRWQADMRAIRRWQAAAPGREQTWPDHADLVVWLLEQLDAKHDWRIRVNRELAPKHPPITDAEAAAFGEYGVVGAALLILEQRVASVTRSSDAGNE